MKLPPPMSLWAIWSFLLISSIHAPCFFGSAAHFSNETDRLALLHLKHLTTDDPLHSLSSWNHTLHFCHWQGVTCGGRRHPQRVTALNLTGQKLVGPISPFIGNLSFLRIIDLSNNSFNGPIPEEMGRLVRLRLLSLYNNTFNGENPANLTHCSELKVLLVFRNRLAGRIPTELGSLLKLSKLDLGHNSLTGSIPPSLGNLSFLTYLFLSVNSLEGSIPDDLGRLANLENFFISENEVSGRIPTQLYNLSSIIIFDVGLNRLHGNLPPNLGLILPNLQELYFGQNQFTGPIPVSLSNASGLVVVDLENNSFSGSVPMNFGSLKGTLSKLRLWGNKLGIGKGRDLTFLDSLTNCSSLQVLDVGINRLNGALPVSIANLSIQLRKLILDDNMIFGSIPSEIQNLVSLTVLGMEDNFLTGTIPIGVGKLNKVEQLYLNTNELSGQIPSSLGNISRLWQLSLYENNLSGTIPSTLGNCINLQIIYLHSNKFSSSLPKQIFSFPSLIELYVGNNYFTDSLPLEVGYLKALGKFSVSNNKLSGEIPSSLGNCLSLEHLSLDGNFFQGSIPPTFSTLRGLRSLDLSRNNLSGVIPEYLEKLALQYLNLSFNDLEGELPKQGVFGNASQVSVLGNSKLCGGIQELKLPSCSSQASKKRGKSVPSKARISIAVVVPGLILLSCFFATLYWVRKLRKKPSVLPSAEDPLVNVSYAELFKATDGFSSANLVGSGSFGAVYKGFLDHVGTMVAMKVFNLQRQGALKSFVAECEALRNIRHRNLVKIITCCSSIDFKGNDFKALIYEYMANGSLEKWLHGDGHDQLKRNLKFIQRLNIAIDVASALDYLHNDCETSIIHRDLKPSNILLDDDMTARVGDFGLARFLSEVAQTSSVGMKGSIGYIAPEYAMGNKASAQGDVYSYGILLLEMITGKGPTDDMFKDNLSLHHFAKSALPEQVREIVDPQLLVEEAEVTRHNENHVDRRNRMHDCLISMVKVGVLCSAESPRERMWMKDVVAELHTIKDLYLGVGIHRDKQVR
ncbi:probable LRR receptor-like serine/threonine-protein kinase At3g47570 [Magnolia sinica]|uniref:probable LRR receptor-like serine/threonine-protein kinase At3g47570 n=1 Tax=Magnolia sinica TaxID=86752 RepID=UPI002658F61A|nr:probable LRR receptor-like serine/threonine-protein kinase At3g47570 [Magnolia sinica]